MKQKMSIGKMTTDVLLRLPLYVILFAMRWKFRHVLKMMTDEESILNKNGFFADIVDTQKGC